jgi:hypothetical protein
MIEVACPSCGRLGSLPREKAQSRLVCKKCHTVFHMNAAGRVELGEPAGEAKKADRHGREARHSSSKGEKSSLKDELTSIQLPLKPIGIVMVVLLVGWGITKLAAQPPASLQDCATEAAQTFANDDLAGFKTFATPDSVDELVRWFDAVHPRLVQQRQKWGTKETKVNVIVIDEDREKRRSGSADMFIYPAKAVSRNEAIESSATQASPRSEQPLSLKLLWTIGSRGRWRIDGKKMVETVPQAAPAQ